MISSANLLKVRRNQRERRISGENYGLKKLIPGEKRVFFTVTPAEYGDMSIQLCLHTQRHLSCWNALLHSPTAKASGYPGTHWLRRQELPAQGPWQPQKGEKLSASHSCAHLSSIRQERDREIYCWHSRPFAICKEEAEWDIWSYLPFLHTFRTALIAGPSLQAQVTQRTSD